MLPLLVQQLHSQLKKTIFTVYALVKNYNASAAEYYTECFFHLCCSHLFLSGNEQKLDLKSDKEHSLTVVWTLAALLNSTLYMHQSYFVKLITSASHKGMMQTSEIEEQDC